MIPASWGRGAGCRHGGVWEGEWEPGTRQRVGESSPGLWSCCAAAPGSPHSFPRASVSPPGAGSSKAVACRSDREARESPALGSPAQAEKKMVLIDLPCAAMWMQFPAQGVERGAPVLLEETESRWVLGSGALLASGLTRPGLHLAPGSAGGDAPRSGGQSSGVPSGELQPESHCSEREHPERSCSSPQSSPLEESAPSFLLPGSPPALACQARGLRG